MPAERVGRIGGQVAATPEDADLTADPTGAATAAPVVVNLAGKQALPLPDIPIGDPDDLFTEFKPVESGNELRQFGVRRKGGWAVKMSLFNKQIQSCQLVSNKNECCEQFAKSQSEYNHSTLYEDGMCILSDTCTVPKATNTAVGEVFDTTPNTYDSSNPESLPLDASASDASDADLPPEAGANVGAGIPVYDSSNPGYLPLDASDPDMPSAER